MKKIVIAKLKTSNLKNIHAGVIFDQWNFSMREETDIEDTSTIKEKRSKEGACHSHQRPGREA